jgi:hypothetical protein
MLKDMCLKQGCLSKYCVRNYQLSTCGSHCNPSYLGEAETGWIKTGRMVQGQPRQIVWESTISKMTRAKWTGGAVQAVAWRGCYVSCSLPCWSEVFSLTPWWLLDLTGLNWGWLEIQKRHRIDRQKFGVRCIVRLTGDVQPSLLLFSILIL